MRVTYDKNGRARDGRGRFLSAKKAQQIAWAESGQIQTERAGERLRYRGPDGSFVPADIATTQAERHYFVGTGKRRREIFPGVDVAEPSRAPGKAKEIDPLHLWSVSLAGSSLKIGALGENQYIKWMGEYYKITPEKSGNLSDLFRLLSDRYIGLFKDWLDSPQFIVPAIETARGTVYDIDNTEIVDPELSEGMEMGAEISEFAQLLHAEMDRFVSKSKPKKQRKHATNKAKNARKKGK